MRYLYTFPKKLAIIKCDKYIASTNISFPNFSTVVDGLGAVYL